MLCVDGLFNFPLSAIGRLCSVTVLFQDIFYLQLTRVISNTDNSNCCLSQRK